MFDTVVIGAGIIGMLSARALALRGQRVLVLDQAEPGRQASWAAGGILSPLHPWRHPHAVNRLAAHSQRLWPELSETLWTQTAINPQLKHCGLLVIRPDFNATQWARDHAVEFKLLDRPQAQGVQPGLRGERLQAWMPGIGVLRTPRLLQALLADLSIKGVKLQSQQPVRRLQITGSQVVAVETARQRIPCGAVVMAAGAWSSALLPPSPQLNIMPVRGQMVLLTASGLLPTTMVLEGERYLIPRRDAGLVVGSTVEYAGFDASTSAEIGAMLLRFARYRFPELHSWRIRYQWAGLRPGSAHGIPTICEHPSVRGLFVNVGHFRSGIVLAPAAAELLAQLVMGETSALSGIDARDYDFSAVA